MTLSTEIAAVEERAANDRQAVLDHYRGIHRRIQVRLSSPVTWLLVAATGVGLGVFAGVLRRKRKSAPARRVHRAVPRSSAMLITIAGQLLPTLLKSLLAKPKANRGATCGKSSGSSQSSA
jgi:uncharacterized iron-regulated membrane protein